jgi:hypothetical protein
MREEVGKNGISLQRAFCIMSERVKRRKRKKKKLTDRQTATDGLSTWTCLWAEHMSHFDNLPIRTQNKTKGFSQ